MEITKKNKNFYVWLTPPDRLIDPGGGGTSGWG